MQIRYAEDTDLDELLTFYIRMNEIINTRTNKYNPDNEVFPSEAMVKESIADGGQIVGMEDGHIIAACIVNHECTDTYNSVRWQIEAKKDEFWVIHALRIAPEYEGRGYAKQILTYIIDIASARKQKAIRLDVLEGYSVEKMYTQLGFKYIDTVDIFYEDIGYPTAFRLLEKVIAN